MIIDFLEQEDVRVQRAVTPYREDDIYWGFVDHNNRLASLFSFQFDCEMEESVLGKPVKIGYLNQEAFEIIKKSLLTKSVVCYIDTENQEIYYYRFVINIDQTSTNTIKLHVSFLDEHDKPEELHDLKVYSAKLPTKENKINKCNITCVDRNVFDIEFVDQGKYNLKVSGVHRGMKLKTYVPWNI